MDRDAALAEAMMNAAMRAYGPQVIPGAFLDVTEVLPFARNWPGMEGAECGVTYRPDASGASTSYRLFY